MNIVYKSLTDEIIDACTQADLDNRTILRVELSRSEAYLLGRECAFFPKYERVCDIRTGPMGEFNGVCMEVV